MPTALLLLVLLAAKTQAWGGAEYAGVLTDPDLDELSGLAASHAHPGIFWGHDDGGNEPVLYAIRADGRRVASIAVTGATNVDWEDIASFDSGGRHYLMIADTGDNGGLRKQLTLYVVEEPAKLAEGASAPPVRTIHFRWPDGARDCEAVAVDAAHGDILLVTKKRVPAQLFRLPLRDAPGEQTAQVLATLPGIEQPTAAEQSERTPHGRYRAQVSGADLSPDGRQLAVLTYGGVYLYARTVSESWAAALAARPPQVLAVPWLPQAEAIAWSLDGTSLLVGGETIPSPLIRIRKK